jgi:adenylate kinase family enzyme
MKEPNLSGRMSRDSGISFISEPNTIESFSFKYNGKPIEFYNPSQPRDENGRWSGKGGGGGKGKAKGKSSKSKKQSEASTENTESDEIEKEIQRLNAEPKTKITIEKMAKLQKEVAQAEGSENAPVTHWSLRDPKRYIQKKDIVETFENPTPEHKAWKDSVIESELNPKAVSKNPIAVILMGSPASGKTTTGRPFAERILNGKETTKIDPDSVKGKSKGFEGWNAGAFHEESALISEKVVFPRAVVNNHNLLIDITGKNSNKVAEMARTLKSVGYTIGLVHVDVDDKVALNRASQRFNKPNGRYVPYNYIKGSAQQARNTWNKLTSEGIADIGYSLDGNADRSKGTAPVKATHGNLFD